MKNHLSIREVVAIVVLPGILMCAQLMLAGSMSLFSHHFWFDEWATYLMASDPDPSRVAQALWTALNDNAPGLFVMLRMIGWTFGSNSEVMLRVFAFVCVLLGLTGLYVALRQAFPPLAALAAVLAIWAHPLVLYHAFEARYYAPWFAIAIWFAYLLARSVRCPDNIWLKIGVGVVSILLCTIHYFGVITMLIILSFEVFRGRQSANWKHAITISTPGLLVLMACIPLFIAQRSAVPSATYLPKPSPTLVWSFGAELLLPAHLAVIVAVASLAFLTETLKLTRAPEGDVNRTGLGDIAGLSSLLLLPVALVAFSYLVQGVLLSKYAMVAVAGLAPGLAMAMIRFPRPWLFALCGFFIVSSSLSLRNTATSYRFREAQEARLIDTIRRHTGGHPVTFESHLPHVLAHYAPDLANRLCFSGRDMPPLDPLADPVMLWSRHWAQRYSVLYRNPGVMSWETLRRLPRKFIVLGADPLNRLNPPTRDCADFEVRHVEDSLYELIEKNQSVEKKSLP